jgi:uncharacterized OB-fold protein
MDIDLDPRPQVVDGPYGPAVMGLRCPECGYVTATTMPRCPDCHAPMHAERVGSTGIAWSSTVVRIAIADRQAPYVVAYIDLDDGPRILAHVSGASGDRIAPGCAVRVVGTTEHGDVRVEATQ